MSRLALLLLVASALVPAAASAASPTRSEFIRKGDALCAQTARKLAPVRARAEAAKSLPEAQKWAATVDLWNAQLRIQKDFVARFRAIGVPAGDATARSLVAGLDKGLVLAQRVRDGFAKRNTALLAQVLPEYVRFSLNLNRRVVRYGFDVCGRAA